ncbi:MAG: penicillin acylase family protein [Acidobacteria bacterium]|nr:penicillin acylase family protein [Candidatus Sulfomarinibacter kjeldsenii]
MIRRVWFILLAITVLLGVVAVLALTHLRMRAASSRLPERGTFTETVVGCPARVEVLLDERGIPHVESASESAMWFSLGYLHARERFFQMELGRRAGAGRLAEIFGESALDNDRKMRTLRLAASARRQSALLSPEERRVLEHYAAGVNAAINRFGKWISPESWLLGVEPEPWQVEDSLTIGLLMQLDLSWAMGEELKRAVELARLGRERAVDLWGWTRTQARAWIPPGEGVSQPRRDYEPITPPMGGLGSNSWAVSPARSAAGRPLLANDPHLGVQMPGSFFAVHLRGPRTHVAGATIAGIPGVIIGHTEDVAWGLTLAMVDDQDLFSVTLDEAGTRELIDGRWQSLRTVTEDVSVRWQDAPVLLKVRFSRHGPLVREQRGETLALSWTGFQGPSMASAILGMNSARSVEEAGAAWDSVLGPAMNLVAADSNGHILHRVVGWVPDRGLGAGRLPSPGSDSRWAWSGFRRVAATSRMDPQVGFVATANHDLFGEGDFPERDRFPGEFAPPWRVRRIRQALAARSDWTVKGFADLQGDVVSGRAIAVLRQLRPEFEEHLGVSAEELMTWDAKMEVGSTATTLFSAFMLELEAAVADDEAQRDGLEWNPLGQERLLRLLAGGLDESWWDDVSIPGNQTRTDILDRVLQDLDRRGPQESWGKVHQVNFDHPLTRLSFVRKLAADSWSRGPFAVAGGNTTINGQYWSERRPFVVNAIPAMRFVADVGNWDDTILVLPVGQSGRPWSRHYSNQISSWLNVEAVRFPFSREAVEAAAAVRIELFPAPAKESKAIRDQ